MTREQACRLLEVAPAADLPAIRAQYRKLASRFHPDRFHTPDEREAATEQFQAIAEAFALLRSEARERKRRPAGSAPRPTPPMQPAAWTRSTTQGATPIWWDRVDAQATAGTSALGDRNQSRLDVAALAAGTGDRAATLFLIPLLLPSIIARGFSRAMISLFDDGLRLPEALSIFLGLVAGHVIPGYLGLELGRAFITSPDQRSVAVILYGLWWIVSGALAFAMDRVA